MTVEGKIEKSEFTKPWQMPEGKGTIYYHNLKVEGDDRVFNVGAKKESPDFLSVGKQIKLDVTEGKNGWKAKVVRENSFSGGGRKPILKLVDIKRMCRSNALNLMYEVNKAYAGDGKGDRIKSSDLSKVEEFSVAGINADIDKFGEEDSLLTSRLSALNQAAAAAHSKSLNNIDEVLELAKNHYNYIKG